MTTTFTDGSPRGVVSTRPLADKPQNALVPDASRPLDDRGLQSSAATGDAPRPAAILCLLRSDLDPAHDVCYPNPLDAAEACAAGESGHVWVNTPALMRGYLGRDDLTAAVVSAGWFHTGDVGLLDERSWLYLRGREREEINKGGMKIHPADVDAVVERFEHTVDVCTFAVDDALLGEDVGLAVVLRGADPATLCQLHDWMARHLASHQMPRRWYAVDEIPRSARGKIDRSAVAARCAGLQPVDLRRMLRERA